jgi:hypothetical protein
MVACCCEHGNEQSGSLKCAEFLDQLSVLPCSVGLLAETSLLTGKILNFPQLHFQLMYLRKRTVTSSSFTFVIFKCDWNCKEDLKTYALKQNKTKYVPFFFINALVFKYV